jgi:hypothetical protein
VNDYTPPTPAELAALTAALGLTRHAVGQLVGSTGDPRRTAAKWITGERSMPFSALYTLASRAGGIACQPDTWRTDLAPLLAAPNQQD